MATSLSLENDSSLAQGYLKVNGSTAATLTTSGITGNLVGNVTGNVTGSLTQGGSLTLATAQTATGLNAVDFTGIPSWVKRIAVMFDGVSLTGDDSVIVQIGGSGGIENTGYNSFSTQISITPVTDAISSTSGFIIYTSNRTDGYSGVMSINLLNGNTWTSFGNAATTTLNKGISFAGSKTLSSTLDKIRITRSGTSTFDAGIINISYEG
jgi:hypothetical protein